MAKTYIIRCKGINDSFNSSFCFNNAWFETKGLLPGEKAEVSLLYGRDKGRAKLEKILEPSDRRIEPVCPVYERCGGCAFLHTDYENELSIKERVVRDLLSDFGNVSSIVGMDGGDLHYRNKIHATLSSDRKKGVISGLYEETTHSLVNITECAIEAPQAAAVMKTIRGFMNENGIRPFDEDSRKGTLRHVLFRVSSNGDTLVVPVCGSRIFPEKRRLAERIADTHPFVKGIVLNYNTKKTSFVLGDVDELLFGTPYVTDTLCGIDFRISPHSFYQVNTVMAERIYTDAIRLSGIGADDTILDAYCGIGTIACVAAHLSGAREVTGVELNAAAVRDAKENAKNAGLNNLRFINEDAGDFLSAAVGAELHYSCVIMDPPRSGASDHFIAALCRMKPETIIYISCNPKTLARDLRKLASKGYTATYIRPYDLFPHTANVETVCLLSNRKPDAYVHIDVDLEDYYKIKDSEIDG